MIRPTKLGVKHSDSGGFSDDEEEDVVISLTSRLYFFEDLKKRVIIQYNHFSSRDPNVSVARVRWDNNMGEFVPLHFTETMIDHLEIDSVIHHVDSDEARAQVRNLERSNIDSFKFVSTPLQICSMSRPGCSTLLTRVRPAAREGREEERILAQVNRRKR